MTRAELLYRLTVERFGDPAALRRERWTPVPPYRPHACDQGPSIVQMTLEAALDQQAWKDVA